MCYNSSLAPLLRQVDYFFLPSSLTSTPHSSDAEQAVLGRILSDPDSIVDVMAIITADDFYDPVHRDIFRTMTQLHEESRGFDLLTLVDKMKDHVGFQSCGGSAYLAELTTAVPTAADVERHALLLKNKAIHRAVAVAGQRITNLGADENLKASDVLEQAEQQILSITRLPTKSDPQTPYEIGKEAYDHYAELQEADDTSYLRGIQTGFRELDGYLQGIEPGAFVIIAARPSIGKTSLALNIARNVADQQHKSVTFVSLEMDKRQVFERLLAASSDVDASKLRQGQLTASEFAKVAPAVGRFEKSSLYIDDDCDASLMNIRSKARRMKMKHGLDLLIIDYLQLIEVRERSARENRTQEVTYLSRSLNNLARELECPIIALSQLSRAVESRSPAIPVLADLRDSGSIEQDADMVLMLYREEYYNEDCDSPGVTDVFIRKHRSGPTGRVSLFFDAKRMTFRPLTRTANPARSKMSV